MKRLFMFMLALSLLLCGCIAAPINSDEPTTGTP